MRFQTCLLRAIPSGIEVVTPYDSAFVADLKMAVPGAGRRWDGASKAWIVAPQYADHVAGLIQKYFGQSVSAPPVQVAAKPETKMIRLQYLGAAKDREDGTQSAFGWGDGGWNFIFPIAVLQAWFCVDAKPGDAPTLYGILGLGQDANSDTVKSAFRRLARQWHPDVCREPDAAAQFRAIKNAYDVLSDDQQRRRYNAGLRLAGMTVSRHSPFGDDGTTLVLDSSQSWRPPLRCGWLLVDGVQVVGRFVVSRIKQWEDIIAPDGRTMVVSWPFGAKTFETRWI